LLSFDALDVLAGRATPRLYLRRLGVLPNGASCTIDGVCRDGVCTGGKCCDRVCDGVCNACGKNGCVDVPPTDGRCGSGPVSCAPLDSECRDYSDLPASRCASFGRCAQAGSLDDCTTFSNKPDGTACSSVVCGGMGQCLAGGCSCMSVLPTFPPRQVPGCNLSGARPGGLGALALIALALLLLGRRARVLLLLALGGCTALPPSLDLTLQLSDAVFTATGSARIIVSPTDGTVFGSRAPTTIEPGITVMNGDFDGDRMNELVVEIGGPFAFRKTNRFALVPGTFDKSVAATVRAEIYDGLGNRFARLGGAARGLGRERVAAVLVPGEVTRIDPLVPECTGECPLSTWQLGAAQSDQELPAPGPTVSAMAVGNLRGHQPARFDLVTGSESEPRSGAANAGHVHVHFGGTAKLSDMGDVVIEGAQGGDRAGAAIAVTNIDGDAAQDLVIGAPGAFQTRGAVYVIYGGASWPDARIDLSQPNPRIALTIGRNIGDRFGSALATSGIADTGKYKVIVGAPGISVAYLIGEGQFPRGGMKTIDADGLPGKADSGFGTSVAQAGGTVAIGAPFEGAAYTIDERSFLDRDKLKRTAGEGGGYGTRVEMARLDSGGVPSLVVAAPAAGAVYVHEGETTLTLRGPPARKLGVVLGRLQRDVGDLLMIGAPGDAAGAVYLVCGPSLRAVPAMEIGDDGQPAAAALAGAGPGDRFGTHFATGDFDSDGALDLAVAADGVRNIYLFRGPL
jgi:hypothetical protein